MKATISQRRIRDYVYLSIFALINFLILFFASVSGEDSANQSGILLDATNGILKFLNINLNEIQLENIHAFIRKAVGHFGIFMVSGIFGWLSARAWLNTSLTVKFSLTMGIGILIGSLSEIIQIFASNRGPSFGDVVIDSLGFFVGIVIVYLITLPLDNRKNATS